MRIFVDGDACPVKDEVLKVAGRHQLPVVVVSNRWHRLDHWLVTQVVVPEGADAADDAIVEQAEVGDMVVTADIPLAARVLAKGAKAIDPRGRFFDDNSIGMKVAMRDLMKDLRDSGEITKGPAVFGPKDRSRFLDGMERLVQTVKRERGA